MNKVWTYIISRTLSADELQKLNSLANDFVAEWTAHQNKLAASVEIFENKILIVRVNESVSEASGCSIDKLLRFIKSLETEFRIELLNRFLVAYKTASGLEITHANKIKELLEQKQINENTLVLNTAVSTEKELSNWEVPLKNTWLSKYLVRV